MPRAQRRYGYFVMPILHDDRLIGRVDPRLDRTAKRLIVHALHREPDVVATPELVQAVETALGSLAAFVGADGVSYGEAMPAEWARSGRVADASIRG